MIPCPVQNFRKFLLALFVLASGLCAQTPLAFESFSFRQFEGGPPFPSGTSLREGDALAFQVFVSGFQTVPGDFEDKVHLKYEVSIRDTKQRLLAEPLSGKIETTIGEEDKKENWKPKIEGQFYLPLYLLSATHQLHINVTDMIAKKEISSAYPFSVEGPSFTESSKLSLRDFHFYRTETDKNPLEILAFRAADPIFARFLITGFQSSKEKLVNVTYGIRVTNAEDKVLFEQPVAAEEIRNFNYPPGYLPGAVGLHLSPNTPKGLYTVSVFLKDRISHQEITTSYTFSIE